MKPATVNRHLALLRSALRWAKTQHYHHRDPMAGVMFLAERNKRERLCTADEYESLLEATDQQMRLAIVLGYEMGLRRTEACSLSWAQVDLKARELRLRADETKTDEPRRLPLTQRAYDELNSAPRRMDGLVVGLKPDHVTHVFTALCGQLEIEGLIFHDLRATAITHIAKSGATLAELQQFSGHKSVQALMRYLKSTVEGLREVVGRADKKR